MPPPTPVNPAPAFLAVASKHMNLFETHHASMLFAHGPPSYPPALSNPSKDCFKAARPQHPLRYKPCKIASKYMNPSLRLRLHKPPLVSSHHASCFTPRKLASKHINLFLKPIMRDLCSNDKKILWKSRMNPRNIEDPIKNIRRSVEGKEIFFGTTKLTDPRLTRIRNHMKSRA